MNMKSWCYVGLFVLLSLTGVIFAASRCTAVNPADGMAAYLMVVAHCPEMGAVPPVRPSATSGPTQVSTEAKFRLISPGNPRLFLPDLHDRHLVMFFWNGR